MGYSCLSPSIPVLVLLLVHADRNGSRMLPLLWWGETGAGCSRYFGGAKREQDAPAWAEFTEPCSAAQVDNGQRGLRAE